MQRSKVLIVTSHCVLNQNAVVSVEARSPGIMKSAVDWCHDQGYGIVQLPCPEFTYLGPERPPMTREQYDTPEFRAHCRTILASVIDQLKVYQQHGYTIAGGLGIQSSPSCDPGKGVFMEEFQAFAREAGVAVDYFWQIPDTAEGTFDASDPRSVYGAINAM